MEKVYRFKSIFQSIQGEGILMGTWCWFLKFAGCNMVPKCNFCDVDWQLSKQDLIMTKEEIMTYLENNDDYNTKWLILTGGEPLLFLDDDLVDLLKTKYSISIETNGTIPLGSLIDKIDHIVMSPKVLPSKVKLEKCHTLKILYPFPLETGLINQQMDPVQWKNFPSDYKFVQPLNIPTIPIKDMTKMAITKVAQLGGDWRISVQLHKFLGIE